MDIGKLIRGGALFALTGFAAAAVGLYFNVPARFRQLHEPPGAAKQTYTCPMHAEVVQDHPGQCPKCGMSLIPAGQTPKAHDPCGEGGANHPGCCSDKSPAVIQLPPGHPPIPGMTVATNAPDENTISTLKQRFQPTQSMGGQCPSISRSSISTRASAQFAE